ncbi:MAG: HNH endonuclease [Chthoniobacteraceae bacterium]
MGSPEYAAAVSIIFTKATNQAIMLGTAPRHVLSTSLLCNSLLHDSRFKRIPMTEAAPGDIIIASGGHQQAGYAGIVVDHGRIVSMGRDRTVRNNSSLVEVQSNRQPMALFQYIGVQKYRIDSLANAGFNPNEPRIPKGQHGGGQWTTGGAAGGVQNEKDRAANASRLELLAKHYLEEAKDEDQKAALAFDEFGMGDEYQCHELAAKAARDLAAEMQWRAYILTHGTEANYRNLILKEYGINNPDLDTIAAYYAEKFNDQPTLNWLKLQHPAPRPRLDPNGLAMMALFPEGKAAEEAPQTGSPAEKSVFEQASDIEKGTEYGDTEASDGMPQGLTGGGQTAKGYPADAAQSPKIPTIRGRFPINSRFAGGTHPSGIKFTSQGFPDFRPHSVAEVEVEGLTGNLAKDSAMANTAAGLDSTPKGYVWHHLEDGKTMQLVPREIHKSVGHTGGAAVIRNGGFDPK